ncbi:MAG: iron transporter [Candidatus Rokuibacteriota bacterium]|nr:MAG: iron transporter [Candidatus Rokubacteria bacterium]
MNANAEPDKHSHNPLVRYFRTLGPGLVTGAADDDPSGVTTYAVAGAAFGTGMLWTAVVSLPLMAAIQLICARIGVVSGRGLAGAMRAHYPRWFLYAACVLLLVANVFNIAADLAGMADAAETLTGVTSGLWVPVFGLLVLAATIYTSYATFALWLKWLTAVLFAYVISAFLAHPNWANALRDTLVPRLSLDAAFVSTLVGILGTTISPYLFFWQASQEVEEERALGRHTVRERHGATDHELRDVRRDVVTGMVFSNVVMYFIMLSAAATLHRAGRVDIETSRQAAEALRPLAGNAAYLLFTLGLVGTGLLAIPILAGSASYAVAEVFGWRSGLDLSPRRARRFYAVLGGAIVAGALLDSLNVSAVRMMFLSAVLNGLLAAPLLVLVMLVGNNRKIMGRRVNDRWLNVLGWSATGIMTVATLLFFWTSL